MVAVPIAPFADGACQRSASIEMPDRVQLLRNGRIYLDLQRVCRISARTNQQSKQPPKPDKLTRHRILILINKVFGHVLMHELVSLLGHPCMDEGRQVEEGRAVQRELVVDELICGICVGAL